MADNDQFMKHGASALPGAAVESFNLDIRKGGEILNNRVRKGAFIEKIEA